MEPPPLQHPIDEPGAAAPAAGDRLARLLRETSELAIDYLRGLPARRVGARGSREQLAAALGGPLPESGEEAAEVVRALAAGADPGLIASAGPRYFGFVIGGSVPASLAADWLTSAWDQNAGIYATSPAASVVEEVAAGWLLELLRLPPGASVGFVTGCQMAHTTALAAARNGLLRRAAWDVEEWGLAGAPPIHIVIGAEAHVTVLRALRLLGFGSRSPSVVPTDSQGRMDARALRAVLAGRSGPTLICAQAGNVNSGAFDPLADIAEVARCHEAWLHIDGAFGLWAAASPAHRHLVAGAELAQSWAVDGHKWLNVPYDSGIAIVADPAAHRAAMTASAAYLQQQEGRDALDWVPEFSRRARGFTVYAALRALGRRGVAELVDNCCRNARYMASLLRAEPAVEILNKVVLNQVLVRFHPGRRPQSDSSLPRERRLGGGPADELTRATVRRVQRNGVCWLGGTTWHGMAAMRISISGWATSESDVEASAAAILAAARAEIAAGGGA
ncbi:MAG TPA: pyridoxal-dependent decarboxylase [Thermoanaerobaculia bacterium]|nr:pyridoxal-dependent decarboxylase [Thermoanaerobaculia bacterium]